VSRELYEFGDFRLDPAHRTLEGQGGAAIALTTKPFDALVHLVEHPGEAVSRKALTKVLWPDTIVEDNNLTQAISALRGVLGNGYIATLPGRGYQFIADVRRVGKESGASPRQVEASGPVAADSPADAGALAGFVGRRWWRAAAAVVVVALAVLVIGFFWRAGG
jgi:DNA-binding winged helix-turn-helix (wHTH) protein